MRKDAYTIEHLLEQFNKVGYTNFINEKEFRNLKNKLPKNAYQVYKLFTDSSYVILYKKEIPPVSLLEIESKETLRHQDVMGAVYHLGLKEDTFGDIFFYKEKFYVFLLPSIKEYFMNSLAEIKRKKINVKEVDLSLREMFEQSYIQKELIVSSLRFDTILSALISCSRSRILEKFKNKEILLNLEENCKPTYLLKIGDTFSVKKYGKYKYNGIVKKTKKGGYVIEVLQYK